MLKKLAVATLAVAAGMFILSSTHLGGYARTAWKKVRETAKKQVPLEFQIETLRNEVARLTPEMRKHISAIAAEDVATKQLRDQVLETRVKLEQNKDRIRAMADALKNDTEKTYFDLSGKAVKPDRLRQRLALDLVSAKRCEEELKTREQLLDAKERGLEAAREQLAGMRSQKDQLEVQISQLEAELKTLRVAETRSNFQIDDSHFNRVKEMIQDVKGQMEILKRTAELNGEFSNDIFPAIEKPQTKEQLLREAEAFTSGQPAAVAQKK